MTHVPTEETRRQVQAMAGYGLDHEAMCAILAITLPDLQAHYSKERLVGAASAEAKVRQALYQQAVQGSVQAQKLWLEQNAGGF